MNFHTFHTGYLFSAEAWNGAIGTQLHFGHDVLPRDGKGEGVGAISSHKRFNVKRDACIIGNVIMFLAGAKGGAGNGLASTGTQLN